MQSLNNLLNRKILTISDPKYSKLKFTVLQWNALPRCYSNPTSYPRAQPEHVNFDYRKDMISQEIRSFDADLVCLEEIDTTDIDFFKSLFNTQKYHFLYEKKVYSNDAVVLAVNKKFEVIETERVVHLKSDDPNDFDNQVSLVAVLKYSEKNFNYYAIVSVVHVKAGPIYR
jgi:mRNA deadenylase, exonuclease subunit and related nucleases